MKKTLENESCLTVARRATVIRQDAEENLGMLLTLGEAMRRAYQVEQLIEAMRWGTADFCVQRIDGTRFTTCGTLTNYEQWFGHPYYENPSNRFVPYYNPEHQKWCTCRAAGFVWEAQ